jgi:hypothetical protein
MMWWVVLGMNTDEGKGNMERGGILQEGNTGRREGREGQREKGLTWDSEIRDTGEGGNARYGHCWSRR